MSLSQYHPASTLTHKPLLHFEEKKLRERKQTREGQRTEEGEDGRAEMKSSGGGHSLPKQLRISQSQ